jgi:hypothetical protein
MIEWKAEALEAAWNAMFETPFDGTQAPMVGAGLDAAVKAQGGVYLTDGEADALSEANDTGYERGVAAGRAEAFEDAAKYMEATLPHLSLKEYASAIRNLAKEGK